MCLRVLIYGHDLLLLSTRSLLLTHEGFQVLTATDRTEAIRLLASQPIDLLLPCHSLSEDEFKNILAAVRVLARPPRVLALIAGEHRPEARAEFASFNIMDGPKPFLAAVHGLLDKHGGRPQTHQSNHGATPCTDSQAQ